MIVETIEVAENPTLFNYDVLHPDVRRSVRMEEEDIEDCLMKIHVNFMQILQSMRRVKNSMSESNLHPDQFYLWAVIRFNKSKRTIERWMAAEQKFQAYQHEIQSKSFDMSAIVELGQPSVPEEAIVECIDLIEAHDIHISKSVAAQIIKKHKIAKGGVSRQRLKEDLPTTRIFALAIMFAQGKKITVAEMSDRTGISEQGVRMLLNRVESKTMLDYDQMTHKWSLANIKRPLELFSVAI